MSIQERTPQVDLIPIEIYTDGACKGNPGIGGYGIVFQLMGQRVETSGSAKQTTNNQMELQGVISALQLIPQYYSRGYDITVYTDSRYVTNGFVLNWVRDWKRRGWRKADGKPVANLQLWKKLDELVSAQTVKFIWVKGHSDNEFNNRCDELANEAIAELRKTSV